MRPSPLRTDHGFTYVAVLMMVLIIGIMLGAAGQVWTTVMKREREAELLFRGGQIRDAIERWKKPRPGQPPPRPITDLKDLLLDPNSLQKIRYLRRLYQDPITGKDWVIVKDPATGIIGVAGLRHAGAKKCVTVARSGRSISAKMRAAGSELVFEVMIASAATRASTAAKIVRLRVRFSVAASITQSQPAIAS